MAQVFHICDSEWLNTMPRDILDDSEIKRDVRPLAVIVQ